MRVDLVLNSLWVDTFTRTLKWTLGLLRLVVHLMLGIVRATLACNSCGHAHISFTPWVDCRFIRRGSWFCSHHVIWYLCHFPWTKVGSHSYNHFLKHQLFWTDSFIAGPLFEKHTEGGSVPLTDFAIRVYIFPVTRGGNHAGPAPSAHMTAPPPAS